MRRSFTLALAVSVVMALGAQTPVSAVAEKDTTRLALVGPAKVVVGTTFHLRGRLPRTSPRAIRLQARHGSAWRTLARSTRARPVFSVTAGKVGVQRYRLVVPRTRATPRRTSASWRVQVVARPRPDTGPVTPRPTPPPSQPLDPATLVMAEDFAFSDDMRFLSYPHGTRPNGPLHTFVADLAAGSFQDVTPDAQVRTKYSDLSADGRIVAFEAEGDLTPDPDASDENIYATDRLTGARQLVNRLRDRRERVEDASYPRLSADGRTVAYTAETNELTSGVFADGYDVRAHAYRSDLRSRSVVCLDCDLGPKDLGTTDPVVSASSRDVSADGTRVLFLVLTSHATTYADGGVEPHYFLWQGGTITPVEPPPGWTMSEPVLHRDGVTVSFEGVTPSGVEVSVMDLRTGAVRTLTTDLPESSHLLADVSGNGDVALVVAKDPDVVALYAYRISTGERVRLPEFSYWDYHRLSGDGSLVAYARQDRHLRIAPTGL